MSDHKSHVRAEGDQTEILAQGKPEGWGGNERQKDETNEKKENENDGRLRSRTGRRKTPDRFVLAGASVTRDRTKLR